MKFLIADDHALFREGIKFILMDMNPEATIIEASTSQQAIEISKNSTDIDLILLDLRMPDLDGISAMQEIVTHSPSSLVVILTASERLSDMRLAMSAGAMGYICKSTSAKIMKSALLLVLSGGVYVPPAMISNANHTGGTTENFCSELTPRQSEILKLIVDGQSNKQIADILKLTEATIKTHVSAIFKALNVKNRTHAALVGQKLNLFKS